MFPMYFDPLYLIILVPTLFLALGASLYMRFWTSKYMKKGNLANLNGADIVKDLIGKRSYPLQLQISQGYLSDNFNPTNETLSLSKEVAGQSSIAAVGIAAHELGHVEQYYQGSALLSLRSKLVPAVNFGSTLGYLMIIGGLILGLSGLAWLGVVFFALTTVFAFVTLPVEIDASRRALVLIRENNWLAAQEMDGVKKVLNAAALTYVAALVQSLGNLLYFVMRVQGMNRN